MSSTFRHVCATLALLTVGAVAVGVAFVWSGVYDIGADAPHTAPVRVLLAKTVERSIAVRADAVQVPPQFDDPARVTQGAGNYDAMCVQCHLAPGLAATELSKGLYPAPPDLTKYRVRPAHAFWVIKHGIKASGMPAWGLSMDDEFVWNLAAFLQRLPDLDPEQYREMVASSEGHSHGGGETGGHPHEEGKEPGHGSGAEHGQQQSKAGETSSAPPPATSSTHVHANGKAHKHDSGVAAPQTKTPDHTDDGHRH
ncbi:MAG: cytochrome c [Burkholderiales bacterium]